MRPTFMFQVVNGDWDTSLLTSDSKLVRSYKAVFNWQYCIFYYSLSVHIGQGLRLDRLPVLEVKLCLKLLSEG